MTMTPIWKKCLHVLVLFSEGYPTTNLPFDCIRHVHACAPPFPTAKNLRPHKKLMDQLKWLTDQGYFRHFTLSAGCTWQHPLDIYVTCTRTWNHSQNREFSVHYTNPLHGFPHMKGLPHEHTKKHAFSSLNIHISPFQWSTFYPTHKYRSVTFFLAKSKNCYNLVSKLNQIWLSFMIHGRGRCLHNWLFIFDFRKNNNFNTSPKVTKKYYYNYNHQSIFWFAKNKPRNSCTHVQYVLPQLNAPYITNTHTNYYICIYTQQYQLGGYLPISVIIYKPCSLCRILYCHNDRVKWYFLEHILCEFFNQIISY